MFKIKSNIPMYFLALIIMISAFSGMFGQLFQLSPALQHLNSHEHILALQSQHGQQHLVLHHHEKKVHQHHHADAKHHVHQTLDHHSQDHDSHNIHIIDARSDKFLTASTFSLAVFNFSSLFTLTQTVWNHNLFNLKLAQTHPPPRPPPNPQLAILATTILLI